MIDKEIRQELLDMNKPLPTSELGGANKNGVRRRGAWVIAPLTQVPEWLWDQKETIHLSPSCRCRRYSIVGVPAGCVDVLVDVAVLNHYSDNDSLVLLRAEKRGKYDHKIRDHWTIRRMVRATSMHLPEGELLITESPTFLSVRVLVGDRVASRADYKRLPPINNDHDPIRCLKRNWTRYYRHLLWDTEVEPVSSSFTTRNLSPITTLSELNQEACRFLDEVSFSNGWSKVPLAVAKRKGIEGLWHKFSQ